MAGNLRARASGEMFPMEMPSGWVALSPGIWTAPVAPPEPLFPLWLVLWAFVEGSAPDLWPSGWPLSSANRSRGRR